MKIVRYQTGRKTRYGILEGEVIREFSGEPYRSLKTTGNTARLSEVKLLAPCAPTKIVALGLNYRSHADEFKVPPPREPLIFLKPSTSVIGPEDRIIYPAMSQQVDYEGELGAVIGKPACRVSREEALNYVFGYTCVNDVTARDIQPKDRQWTRCKGFDTFCPIGPWIETEMDTANLHLETRLNGVVKQSTSTSYMVFDVARLVSFISEVMTLLPGDVIATGTTSGIGPMQPGDTVEVEIERIGVLRNYVARE